MAISIYDTHTLIATVNSPEIDVQRKRPFLLAKYYGAPEPTESDTVDILKRTGTRGLATFTAQGAAANVVSDALSEVIATVKYPFIREKTPIKASDLLQMQESSRRIYRSNPESLQQIQDRVINDYLTALKLRVERREQWMIAESLTKGVITYKGQTGTGAKVQWKIDLGIDSSFFPVLSGTARWGQSAAAIPADFGAWTALINAATGGYGGDVILGTNAAALLQADATVKAELNNLNFRAGALMQDQTNSPNSMMLGNYAGFTFTRWAETYLADDATTQPFFPTNGVLVIGSTFKGRRLFGLNEEFVGGMPVGDAYFSKSWDEMDPAVRHILVASRPLPIPEEEGSWVYATVA